MSPLSLHPHPLPGTHQKTLSKHSSPYQRGPRAPPSPCRPSRSTPSKARLPPALQRASTPSPPCPGPRASGSPSVKTSLHLAGRARGRPPRSSRGFSPAPAGQAASSLTTLLTPTAERRAAGRTTPAPLMSSLGSQIGRWQQLHRAKYSMVTLLLTLQTCLMPEVWTFSFRFCFFELYVSFFFLFLRLLIAYL